VAAVVHIPWGAHPSELAGHYDYDMLFRVMYFASLLSPDGLRSWMDEWIYGIEDRESYIEHYKGKFGVDSLSELLPRRFESAPADYGFPFTRVWDENDYSNQLGMNMDEFVAMLDEKGVLIDGG
jgi:glutaconate CoA-transferase subunit A